MAKTSAPLLKSHQSSAWPEGHEATPLTLQSNKADLAIPIQRESHPHLTGFHPSFFPEPVRHSGE